MTPRRGGTHATVLAVFLSVAVSGLGSAAAATDADTAPADPLGLAAVLIDGGDAARALVVLREIDLDETLKAEPEFDLTRFYTLRGVASLGAGDATAAIADLKTARARQSDLAGQRRLSLVLANAYASTEAYVDALAALDAAGELGRQHPSQFFLRARAYRALHRPARALMALRVGRRLFPHARPLAEGEIILLVELGLVQEAMARSTTWRATASEEEGLRLAATLLRAEALDSAQALGEEVQLRFPGSAGASVLLAHTAAARGAFSTAAHHFEQASVLGDDKRTIADAAEMYRRADRSSRALMLGVQIDDAEQKARQRFGIYVEQDRCAEAVAMEPRLKRLKILDDEEVRLALSYCLLNLAAQTPSREKTLDRAKAHLRQMTGVDAFRRASALRDVIDQCREEIEKCP